MDGWEDGWMDEKEENDGLMGRLIDIGWMKE